MGEEYEIHNLPGTEYDADEPALVEHAAEAMLGPPVYLNRDHALVLVEQFRETARFRLWTLLATAVLRNHAHVVVRVPGDPDPATLLKDFKSYGSRALTRRWRRPLSGTWWTESGSRRKKADDIAIRRAVRYVRDQRHALAVWLSDEGSAWLAMERTAHLEASRGREPPGVVPLPTNTDHAPTTTSTRQVEAGDTRGFTPPARLENDATRSERKHVVIYTDGACVGNPGPGGYAAVLLCDGRRKELSGGRRLTTNNRMEILAAIEALRALKKPCRVTVHSDSTYLVNGAMKALMYRWRQRVPNGDLWRQLDEACAGHEVKFRWVRGHSGEPENERCDTLSEQAARAEELPEDEGYGRGIWETMGLFDEEEKNPAEQPRG
jgi:ribonuclease HI